MTFCASHTDGYPYLATSYQRSVDLPGTVLRVPTSTDESYQSKEDPSICEDLRECLLDASYRSSDP